MTQANVTNTERKEWINKAYERGFSAFEYSNPSHLDLDPENLPNEAFSVMCSESNEYKRLLRDIEDFFNFERGKHDWDNFGIYPLIEDCTSAYQAGALDGLRDQYNPDNVSHFYE